MPRHPHLSPAFAALRGSPYSRLAHRLTEHPGERYPFHVGDTWMEPAPGCRMEDLEVERHPGMHRYAPVQGISPLIEGITEHTRRRTGLAVQPEEVLVTAGATGGLAALVGALLAPGDEVLILAPFWPLIAGMVRAFHGVPVAVPFIGAVDDAASAVEAVRAHLNSRTVALYVSTPNNPSGRLIPEAWLAALAELAREEDLWLLSDEVYEDYVYEGAHTPLRPMAPERTFSAHSFSKAYGMAGNRVGYLVGPAAPLSHARTVATHTYYSAPTASQLTALRALDGAAEPWLARAKQLYQEVGAAAAARLGVQAPQGSTFLFLDVAEHLDDRGVPGLLEDLVQEGLLLAPGSSFGPYPTHLRLCFTATPPEVTLRGVERLALRLGR